MSYKITENCVNCGACAGACPMAAIIASGGKYAIDPALCKGCGMCVSFCPMGAIAKDGHVTKTE